MKWWSVEFESNVLVAYDSKKKKKILKPVDEVLSTSIWLKKMDWEHVDAQRYFGG